MHNAGMVLDGIDVFVKVVEAGSFSGAVSGGISGGELGRPRGGGSGANFFGGAIFGSTFPVFGSTLPFLVSLCRFSFVSVCSHSVLHRSGDNSDLACAGCE